MSIEYPKFWKANIRDSGSVNVFRCNRSESSLNEKESVKLNKNYPKSQTSILSSITIDAEIND